MQFKQGVRVFTSSNADVGTVDRVVLDPQTKQVTHIVVRKGFLFTEDKVVPIHFINSATEDRVTLEDQAGDLQALPHFQESHYIPLSGEDVGTDYEPDLASPLFTRPDVSRRPGRLEVGRNIPDNTVPLREGAQVISADEKHVGNIERVFTDPTDDCVSHLVIAQGLLARHRKVIPMTWVSSILENEIHLAVNASLLDRLEPYHEVA